MFDYNSHIPKYIQLKDIIRNDILKQRYKNGEAIPSEPKLMEIYGVTRTTIRKALSHLVNEGLLQKIQGKGTFVNFHPIKQSMWNFSGFTNYAQAKGKTPISKEEKREFIFIDGEKYFKLVRLRGLQGDTGIQQYTLDTSIIPLHIFPKIDQHDFTKESLYDVMINCYGIKPTTTKLEIEAIDGNDTLWNLFKCQKKKSLLQVKGSVFDENNIEIEKVNILYSPDINMQFATEFRIDI